MDGMGAVTNPVKSRLGSSLSLGTPGLGLEIFTGLDICGEAELLTAFLFWRNPPVSNSWNSVSISTRRLGAARFLNSLTVDCSSISTNTRLTSPYR